MDNLVVVPLLLTCLPGREAPHAQSKTSIAYLSVYLVFRILVFQILRIPNSSIPNISAGLLTPG